MVDGQVGFHRPQNVRRIQVEKNNSIVNALNKTKVERNPDLYKEQQDRLAEIQAEKKEQQRAELKAKKLADLQAKKEKEELSYDRIFQAEQMTSNAGMFVWYTQSHVKNSFCIFLFRSFGLIECAYRFFLSQKRGKPLLTLQQQRSMKTIFSREIQVCAHSNAAHGIQEYLLCSSGCLKIVATTQILSYL